MKTGTKDFGPVRADYAYFEDHATEAAEDARAYAPHVQSLASAKRSIRMLDFGCGEGKFTLRFLAAAGLPTSSWSIALVEPDGVNQERAVDRLQPTMAHRIEAWPALPADLDASFDVVLANHVFYYVSNLEGALAAIRRALAPGGLLLAAMAGQENLLIQFWNHCFGLIGKPVPYHTAEDLEAALARARWPFHKEEVRYQLNFPDAEENRLRICRFLLGSYLTDVPRRAMLDFFNPYATDGSITAVITHRHFIIGRE